jgi:hypothetical protein
VQVGVPEKPLIVHVFGEAVETFCEPCTGVPLAQATVTATEAALAGDHTLFTVKFAVVSVFVIVQEPGEGMLATQVPGGLPLAP